MRPLVAAGLLLAAALSGCFDGDRGGDDDPSRGLGYDPALLSASVYGIRAPEEIWVESQVDGKRINNAVYRPDTDEKTPVWINFSPYWGDTAMTEGDAFSQYLIHEYVPRGYTVVLSAVRGTGHSAGCFQIGGDLELQDAYDVVDFFSKQSWSNGNVGAGGKSYDSTTQNGMIAKFPHPALKTTLHVSGITDMYRYNGKAGVTYVNGLIFNTQYGIGQGLSEYAGGAGGAGGLADEDVESLARIVDDLACPELVRENLSGAGTAVTGLKDAYWQERDWVAALPQSDWKGSIFFVHGLQDWNVKPDNIDGWLEAAAKNGIAVKGWLHQWEQDGTGHVYPMRTDWNLTMLRWMDHYLKGVDTGIDRELGFDIQGSDEVWRRADTWPPEGESVVVAIPAPPGGPGSFASSLPATILKAERPTRISGVPWWQTSATSFSLDPVLYAQLVDVAPDGTAVQVNEAARRGLLSDDLKEVKAWATGTAQTFNVTFYPMDLVLQPGHRLDLVPMSPDSLLGPDGNAGFLITPLQPQLTYGAATFGLTITDAATRLHPQPTPMECFTC